MGSMRNRSVWKAGLRLALSLVLIAAAVTLFGCGPKAVRGGPGTDNPQLDKPAMSVILDRADIEYLVGENTKALSASALWNKTIMRAPTPPTVAIWPIQNTTSQHIDDQLAAMLSSVETYLVNSSDVRMVSRENQKELIEELRSRQADIYDPQTIGKLGRQLGAQYFVTGKVTSVEERFRRTRRVQYALILQVLEVETGRIVFQNEASRSKALKG